VSEPLIWRVWAFWALSANGKTPMTMRTNGTAFHIGFRIFFVLAELSFSEEIQGLR
jgi:hypothetical protein